MIHTNTILLAVLVLVSPVFGACSSDTGRASPVVGPESSVETTTSAASSTLSSASSSATSAGTQTSIGGSSSSTTTQDSASSGTSTGVTSSGQSSLTSGASEAISSDSTSSSASIDSGSSDGASGSSTSADTTNTNALQLTSPAFEGSPECTVETPEGCNLFPNDNISYMENANQSPELAWSQVPAGTLSFAVTLKDLTYGQPLWAIWNIGADQVTLEADLPKDTALLTMPAGAEQSNASFADGDGYYGPQAPCNVFQFELFALSIAKFEPSYKEYAAEVDAQLNQLGDVVLGRATLAGRTKYDASCDAAAE